MKKQILSFSLVLLALTAMASAQGNDRRVDAARVTANEGRSQRPDQNSWNRPDTQSDRRAAHELDRLNRDVRAVRVAIRNSRHVGSRTRDRFRRVVRATDFLNQQFRRGNIRGWEVRRRADEIRRDLDRIRWELRRR
jgi:hypothetical protein